MAYTPENNPYIPGDPYSYDLKWIVEKIKQVQDLESAKSYAEAAQASAESAENSAINANADAERAEAAASIVDVPFITPEIYGAVGDGVNDDTAAFMRCFENPGVIIMLRAGKTYLIQNTLRLKANTYIFGNNATILCTVKHLFFNFEYTDTYTVYSGNGNILIRDLNIIGGSISFIHAKNVLIDNCHFNNCLNDHIFEICACSHYTITNCTLRGMVSNGSDYINIDPCFYTNFPWIESTSPTFDGTPNEYITVKYCTFEPGDDVYNTAYNAFGVHSSGTGTPANHSHIIFDNNIIKNFSTYGIRINCMDYAEITNNYIEKAGSYHIELGGFSTKIINPIITNNILVNSSATSAYFIIFRSGGFENLVLENNNAIGPINRLIQNQLTSGGDYSIAKLQRYFSGVNGTLQIEPALINEIDIFSGTVGGGTYHHQIVKPYNARNFSIVGEVYPVYEYSGGALVAKTLTVTATGFTTTLSDLAAVYIAKTPFR